MSLQSRSSHTIELWGEPGVGKTTLAKRLVAEYGYQKFEPTNTQYSKALLCIRYPLVISVWVGVICKNFWAVRQFDILRYNFSLLFSSLRKIHFTYESTADKAVIDEGFVQRILSYSDTTYTVTQLQKLFATSPIGTVVIWVNDREVREERYSPLHQRAIPGEAYLTNWKENQQKNIPVVANALRSNKRIKFYETKHTSIEVIMEEINKHD